MLYDVIEHLKRSFTIGSYSAILQRSISDTGGKFKLRRGVFSNLFVSFCNQIRRSEYDQVCPQSIPRSGSLEVTSAAQQSAFTSTQRLLPSCCNNTISIDAVRFAPLNERDDGVAEHREPLRILRQLKPRAYFVIPDSLTRQLLLRWAGLPPKGIRAKASDTFRQTDIARLSALVSLNASFLVPLLQFAASRQWIGVPRSDGAASGFFRLLIRCVACAHPSYPIISGFKEGKLDALLAVACALERAGNLVGFEKHLAMLSEHGIPAFGDLLGHPFLHSCSLQEQLVLVHVLGSALRRMVNLAQSYHAAVQKHPLPPLVRRVVTQEEDFKYGACFAPSQRLRLDQQVIFPSESSHGGAGSQRPTCEYYYKHDSAAMFLPCVVFFWCMCGINLGFQILRRPESVSAIIAILLERFPLMPYRLLYDFSCGLFRTVVGAAPSFFERTAFCHDPMHGKGHCPTCSPAYGVKYVVDTPTRSLNSVIAEQRNERVGAWSKTIEFMTHTNAVIVMTVLLASMNADLKRSTVGQPPNTSGGNCAAVLPSCPPPPQKPGAQSIHVVSPAPVEAPLASPPHVLTSQAPSPARVLPLASSARHQRDPHALGPRGADTVPPACLAFDILADVESSTAAALVAMCGDDAQSLAVDVGVEDDDYVDGEKCGDAGVPACGPTGTGVMDEDWGDYESDVSDDDGDDSASVGVSPPAQPVIEPQPMTSTAGHKRGRSDG